MPIFIKAFKNNVEGDKYFNIRVTFCILSIYNVAAVACPLLLEYGHVNGVKTSSFILSMTTYIHKYTVPYNTHMFIVTFKGKI